MVWMKWHLKNECSLLIAILAPNPASCVTNVFSSVSLSWVSPETRTTLIDHLILVYPGPGISYRLFCLYLMSNQMHIQNFMHRLEICLRYWNTFSFFLPWMSSLQIWRLLIGNFCGCTTNHQLLVLGNFAWRQKQCDKAYHKRSPCLSIEGDRDLNIFWTAEQREHIFLHVHKVLLASRIQKTGYYNSCLYTSLTTQNKFTKPCLVLALLLNYQYVPSLFWGMPHSQINDRADLYNNPGALLCHLILIPSLRLINKAISLMPVM